MPKHILVTGTHRSGTTFVASMLALAPGTSPLFEILSPAHPDETQVHFEKWFQYVGRENEERYLEPLRRALGLRPGLVESLRGARGLRQAAGRVKDALSAPRIVLKEPTAAFAAEWMADRLGMSPVLTIRHPAGFVASNRRLGWAYHLQDLVDQPLLLRGFLAGMEGEIRAALASPEQIVHLSVLWKAVYRTVADLRRRRPEFVFVRHEDVSLRPVEVLGQVYARLGLEMTPRARTGIVSHTTRQGPYGPPAVDDIHRNSADHVRDWERLLEPGEAARIRALTEPVASEFYGDRDW